MSEQFAHGLAIATRLDAARRKCVSQGVEANVRQVVSREKAVVELPIRANLRTLYATADEIGFRIFLPKPLQHRKQNRRKWDVACRRAAFGCGDHDLGPSRAIELLSIDALDCLADAEELVVEINVLPLQGAQLADAKSRVEATSPNVQQMRFGKTNGKEDRSVIVYNDKIRIFNIPLRAYDWQVNGKSPIEWIMERYAVTVNRDSQIRNDPNDWCREHGQPRYILDLIGRIVNVSIQTLDLMASLPPLSFKT